MSNHLSQDQFETSVLGQAGAPELEHIRQCPECSAELERFSKGVALFRRAIHDLAGDAGALKDGEFATLPLTSAGVPGWSWTLAAASIVAAIVLPFFVSRPEPVANAPAEMSPEAVMERLNRHLAGSVPEPMEPMLSLISGEQPVSERNGAQ
jgi:anti-sigma factor RsiW